MKISSAISLGILTVATAFFPKAAFSDGGTSLDSPYYSNPKLVDLLSDVIFYVDYDGENMKPIIAGGPTGLVTTLSPYAIQQEPGNVYGEYAPGLIGKALKTQSGAGWYAAEGNLKAKTSGALTFWFKKEGDGGSVYFFQDQNSSMGMQWQNVTKDKDGKVLVPGLLLAWIKKGLNEGMNSACGGEAIDGKWHFIVVNWAWPAYSVSVDAGPFQTLSLSRVPDEVLSAIHFFQLGSRGGAPTLMDEVMIFNRPLDAAEIKLIYETVSAWAKERAGHDQTNDGKR